jgi:hypothetical protein
LQHQHEALPELIDGLTEEYLKQRINPDKWDAFENIAHLAAYQPMFMARLERIAAEDAPSFDRYVAEKDPLFPQYLDQPLDTLMTLIPTRAQSLCAYLTSLSESRLLRVGLHPKYGRLTIPQWAQFYLLHEAHHLFTIFMLTQDLRSANV